MEIKLRAFAEKSWARRRTLLIPNAFWVVLFAGVVAAVGAFLGPEDTETQTLEQVTTTIVDMQATYSYAQQGTYDAWNATAQNGYTTAQTVHVRIRVNRACADLSGLVLEGKVGAGFVVATSSVIDATNCGFEVAGQFTSIASGATFVFEMRHKWNSFPNVGGTITFGAQAMSGAV